MRSLLGRTAYPALYYPTAPALVAIAAEAVNRSQRQCLAPLGLRRDRHLGRVLLPA